MDAQPISTVDALESADYIDLGHAAELLGFSEPDDGFGHLIDSPLVRKINIVQRDGARRMYVCAADILSLVEHDEVTA